MTFCLLRLRWILCLFLAANGAGIAAATPDPQMRAALKQLVAAHKLENHLPALLEATRVGARAAAMKGAYHGITADGSWTEAERRRATSLMDELAPQMAAAVDAEFQKMDLGTLAAGMVEAVYPKYFKAEEIVQLAAYYRSPAYQKLLTVVIAAQEESARTGQDLDLAFKNIAATRMNFEEGLGVAVFRSSPLGRKHRELGPRIDADCAGYLRERTMPAVEAALARYRKTFATKMKLDPAG